MLKRRQFLSLLAFILVAPLAAQATDTSRFIDLDSVSNTRDLGGLPTEDGRSIRNGQLIRSGEIDHISPESMAILDEMGVSAIIDLRTTKEATKSPSRWPDGTGPERLNFPLLENQIDMIDELRSRVSSGTAEAAWMDETFRATFGYIPTDYPEEIRKVFDVLLAQPEGKAVLFHCSGGKDRTGIVTVLLLSALGVDPTEIESDFLLSNIANEAYAAADGMAAEINAVQGTSMTGADVWPLLGVRGTYLEHFYQTLEAEYGGVDGYLHDALGLTDADIEALKARYLE